MARPVSIVEDEFDRPELDERHYRLVELQNGFRALLIHDPHGSQASAALNVQVGSLSNGDLPGAAHAVEHILGMGSKQYPNANVLHEFMEQHGGSFNASTKAATTTYYFAVAPGRTLSDGHHRPSPLHGALGRLAAAVQDPLFDRGDVEREVANIDSEYQKGRRDDSRRLYHLDRSLAEPGHALGTFFTGNWASLWEEPQTRNVDVREALIAFFEAHYSADRMHLAVLGHESLDTLQDWVGKLFERVPRRKQVAPTWDLDPYKKRRPMLTVVKPLRDMHQLDLHCHYRDETDLYDSQPARYLLHLIRHRGPGSIVAYCKSKGWAENLTAEVRQLVPGAAVFTTSVTLTPSGVDNFWQVAQAFFQYVSVLREHGPQKYIYDELHRMTKLNFQYRDQGTATSTTQRLSSLMPLPLPPRLLVRGFDVMSRFDAEAIQASTALLDPRDVRLVLTTQQPMHEALFQTERWYGTQYATMDIPEDLMFMMKAAWCSTCAERPDSFHLPNPNLHLPEVGLTARPRRRRSQGATPPSAPYLIHNDSKARVWWKVDDGFGIPRQSIQLQILGSQDKSIPVQTWGELLVESISHALRASSSDLASAGVQLELRATATGMELMISGYSGSMRSVLTLLLGLYWSENLAQHFGVAKDGLARDYRNAAYSEPATQAERIARWLLETETATPEELGHALRSAKKEDMERFRNTQFAQLYVEALIHGDVSRECAFQWIDMVEQAWTSDVRSNVERWVRNVILPHGSSYRYMHRLVDAGNSDGCVRYVLQTGDATDVRQMACLRLFASLTWELAYDQLRTKETLGYVVSSGMLPGPQSAYFVVVQGSNSTTILEERIEAFLCGLEQHLESMPTDTFARHQESIIARGRVTADSPSDERARLWAHIKDGRYDFDERTEGIEQIKQLTKKDLLQFYHETIRPTGSRRAKLVVHVRPARAPELPEDPVTMQITDAARFQAGLSVTPLATPVRPLHSYQLDQDGMIAVKAVDHAPPHEE